MRRLCAMMLLLLAPHVAPGQVAATKQPPPPGYRVYHTNGTVFRVRSQEKLGKFYRFTADGRPDWQLFEGSVLRVEPLTGPETSEGSDTPFAETAEEAKYRTVARVKARSVARAEARAAESYAPGDLSSGLGSPAPSALSGGYYRGPRQPSGHYAGGSGSSHKGSHYTNSATGNHYQKRH